MTVHNSRTGTAEISHHPQLGLSLAFVGGFALSIDIPLIRLAISDPYMVIMCRGFGLALVLWLYGRFFADRSAMPKDLLEDRDFLIVGGLAGLNNVLFTLAVFNTSTANLVFILAFNALLAAMLSWPMVGERPNTATWIACIATILGVGLIVSDGLGSGNWVGDVLALICAGAIALSLIITRRSGKDLSLAPGFGGLVSALFGLPVALFLAPWPEAPVWLAIDALILVPLAGVTLWLAPRFISAPQVAFFYLLETVLAPLWVWLIFSEAPTRNVLIGGAIVIAAITCHSILELKAASRAKRHSDQHIQ